MNEETSMQMLTEVAIPGMQEMGLSTENLTSVTICKRCNKRSNECKCNK